MAEFIARQGIRHVFVLTGGASVHLIDSIAKHPEVDFVCPQHEQAGAMAADAYARVTGNLGAAISTSGPGATNMVTGICSAFYDSVPVLYITGQVATFRNKGGTGVRQIGFQETEIVPMCRSITNYAVQVSSADDIRYELEKACFLAREGRPGPVLVDLPDDLQRAEVDPDSLHPFLLANSGDECSVSEEDVERCLQLLSSSRRPVVILGWGLHLAHAEKEVAEFLRLSGFPFAPTWGGADLMPSDDPQHVGTFGTHGTRHGNLAVQNADLILSIGSRLDTKATGSPPSTFAREARKIMVDVDPCELKKFEKMGVKIDQPLEADCRAFLRALLERLGAVRFQDISEWRERISSWKAKFPICPDEYYHEPGLQPYVFVKELSRACAADARLVIDTGCTVAWMMQAFEFKRGQRLYHDWNNTAMGWALPASIGASFATDKGTVVCVTGDGSLQMNIQELATVIRHQLPIKIFLVNNHGYSMIQQTQDQWLGSKFYASTVGGGLASPCFIDVARAYGFPVETVQSNSEVAETVEWALRKPGPVFCCLEIDPGFRVVPQVKFGRPNEDPEPLLERKGFLENMLVPPLAVSR